MRLTHQHAGPLSSAYTVPVQAQRKIVEKYGPFADGDWTAHQSLHTNHPLTGHTPQRVVASADYHQAPWFDSARVVYENAGGDAAAHPEFYGFVHVRAVLYNGTSTSLLACANR